jgi:hypothetical protein
VTGETDALKARRAIPGVERALGRALRWTIAGAAVSLPLLAVPQPEESRLLAYTIGHLSALVVFGLVLVWDLLSLTDDTWFVWLRPPRRWLAAGASTVALTVGAVALITLSTSAALRLAPSLQFLQLLSAMDIAFAAGATLIGVSWWKGRRAGAIAGTTVGVVCVWSIWRYLTVVGFASDGGWQVDAGALFAYVLPYDMAAAAVAVATLVLGAQRMTRVG